MQNPGICIRSECESVSTSDDTELWDAISLALLNCSLPRMRIANRGCHLGRRTERHAMPNATPTVTVYAPLWDATDVATYAKISVGTVRNWVVAGRMPKPLHIGRTTRWPADAIVAFFGAM